MDQKAIIELTNELLSRKFEVDTQLQENVTAFINDTRSVLSNVFGSPSSEIASFDREIQGAETERPHSTSVLQHKRSIARGHLMSALTQLSKNTVAARSSTEVPFISVGPNASNFSVEGSTFIGPRPVLSTQAKNTRVKNIDVHQTEPGQPHFSKLFWWILVPLAIVVIGGILVLLVQHKIWPSS